MSETASIIVTLPAVDVKNRRHCEFWIFEILNWFNILHSNTTAFKYYSIEIHLYFNDFFREYCFHSKGIQFVN